MSRVREQAIKLGRRIDWILTAGIVIVAIVFIYMLQDLPQRATFFPWFITAAILLIAAVYSYGKFRKPGKWDAHFAPEIGKDGIEPDVGPTFIIGHKRGILIAVVSFVALVLTTMAIGPEFAVPLFVTVSLALNGENKIVAVLSGVAFWLIIHFVFGDFMSINVPTGYLSLPWT